MDGKNAWDIVETNAAEFSSEDYELLQDGLELRTACCYEVVRVECVSLQCSDGIPQWYLDLQGSSDQPPLCVKYFENGYVYHAECPERKSRNIWLLDRGDLLFDAVRDGEVDLESAEVVVAQACKWDRFWGLDLEPFFEAARWLEMRKRRVAQ